MAVKKKRKPSNMKGMTMLRILIADLDKLEKDGDVS